MKTLIKIVPFFSFYTKISDLKKTDFHNVLPVSFAVSFF